MVSSLVVEHGISNSKVTRSNRVSPPFYINQQNDIKEESKNGVGSCGLVRCNS